MNQDSLNTENRKFWVKVVEMLQHNWAIIEEDTNRCVVYFISDNSTVFDHLLFNSPSEAKNALRRNGFSLYEEETDLQKFLTPPKPPFHEGNHPNGPIYSSGQFWI